MSMTWKEFKEEVEKQMDESGISENEEIWYIDLSCPQKGSLDVGNDESSGIFMRQ